MYGVYSRATDELTWTFLVVVYTRSKTWFNLVGCALNVNPWIKEVRHIDRRCFHILHKQNILLKLQGQNKQTEIYNPTSNRNKDGRPCNVKSPYRNSKAYSFKLSWIIYLVIMHTYYLIFNAKE